MVEKLASSEIAQSRERFEKWAATLPKCIASCDGDLEGEPHELDCPCSRNGATSLLEMTYFDIWQAAERDTRERIAQFIENAMVPESFRKTKIYTEAEQEVDKYFKLLAERIRGKE